MNANIMENSQSNRRKKVEEDRTVGAEGVMESWRTRKIGASLDGEIFSCSKQVG